MNAVTSQIISIKTLQKLVLALTLIITSVAHAADPASAKTSKVEGIDRIVAVVNDEVITQYELNDRLSMVSHQLRQQGTPLPPREVLEKQLLERMINDRVQLQFAKLTGIRVDDVQLDKTLQRIAQDSKLTLPEFRATLEKDGIKFSKFREEIRSEIILSRLRERDVENRIVITDGEIENLLNTQAASGKQEEYNIANILIRVPEQASPETIREKRARAEQALNELKKGTDFRQVSASYSDAQNAMEGGALGWRSMAQIPGLFADALKSMHAGEISAILHSPNGFHILKVLDIRGKDAPMFINQTHARHILIKTNEIVSETDAKNRLNQIKERIENGADFAELARLHSDDASASKGGDLGWLSPKDTVPEFERAMDALQPGQISNPVQSQFGWHLIQVLERRNKDVSAESQKLQARQALRARKADEAYQDFVRQLRDQAYVDYRLEDK